MKYQANLCGQTFGKLTVVMLIGRSKWLCKCECGELVQHTESKLVNDGVSACKKCGLSANTTHGMSRSPEYNSWRKMIGRCTDKDDKSFKDYGEKGIKVCERWMDFNNFIEDMGLQPEPNMTIERVESTGNYEPDNCTWATRKEQARNRSTSKILTLNGEAKTVAEWSEIYGHKRTLIADRLEQGWSVEDAITKPSKNAKK